MGTSISEAYIVMMCTQLYMYIVVQFVAPMTVLLFATSLFECINALLTANGQFTSTDDCLPDLTGNMHLY